MGRHDLTWERPESLRERARWYRAYAEAGGEERAWAIWLATRLEIQASELEANRAAGPASDNLK